MVEWNGIFRLFRFSGILGQLGNEVPENVCSIRSQTRNFRNFWSNGKRPRKHATFEPALQSDTSSIFKMNEYSLYRSWRLYFHTFCLIISLHRKNPKFYFPSCLATKILAIEASLLTFPASVQHFSLKFGENVVP